MSQVVIHVHFPVGYEICIDPSSYSFVIDPVKHLSEELLSPELRHIHKDLDHASEESMHVLLLSLGDRCNGASELTGLHL